MKQFVVFVLAAILMVTPLACAGHATSSATVAAVSRAAATAVVLNMPQPTATGMVLNAPRAAATPSAARVAESAADDLVPAAQAEMTEVQLAGDAIHVAGPGATARAAVLTISSAGTYRISGRLNDGQIVVDTQDPEKVVLLLDAAAITNTAGPGIYVANAEKVVITLAEGTQNYVTDGAAYVFADPQADEPNAAIFSRDDLTINGAGALTVQANYNNGIVSKDDLKITGGHIAVQAVNDGLKGRDSLVIRDGVITVHAGGDGLQANNDEEAEQGYVTIEGGTLNITAGQDGIQAETRLLVSGGKLDLVTGGGSGRRATASAKGLKAGTELTVAGGTIAINAADDALHSNGAIIIGGGELVVASGDDGVHADASFTMNGGDLRIIQSYEGIESNQITVNAGTIHLASADDGINGISTTGAAGGMPGRPGPGGFEAGDSHLYLNGGYIFVDALGDGLDINGAVDMTGGTVLINGPIANNNGALDYFGSFKITGGLLVAVGSAGMAQAPSSDSTQYSLAHVFASPQPAGSLVHVASGDGKALLTFAATKAYQAVVFSSPELVNGATYVIYAGGRSSATATDGLYVGGSYTAGTQAASYTLTSIVTGNAAGMGGMPPMPGMPGGRRGLVPRQP